LFGFWAMEAVEENSETEGYTFMKSINPLFCRHGRITESWQQSFHRATFHRATVSLWSFLLDYLLF